jgi:hypothetical protein
MPCFSELCNTSCATQCLQRSSLVNFLQNVWVYQIRVPDIKQHCVHYMQVQYISSHIHAYAAQTITWFPNYIISGSPNVHKSSIASSKCKNHQMWKVCTDHACVHDNGLLSFQWYSIGCGVLSQFNKQIASLPVCQSGWATIKFTSFS